MVPSAMVLRASGLDVFAFQTETTRPLALRANWKPTLGRGAAIQWLWRIGTARLQVQEVMERAQHYSNACSHLRMAECRF